MPIAASPPVIRYSSASWVLAAVALFSMRPAPPPPHGHSPHGLEALTTRVASELRALQLLNAPPSPNARGNAVCDPSDASCALVHLLATAYAHSPDELWDAYDRVALAHLDAVGIVDIDNWLSTLPPAHAAIGAALGNHRVLFVWSDPVYLSGARASLFARDARGHWTIVAHRSLDLDGQYVGLHGSRDGVFLIDGLLRGGDAEWLSLIQLDARDSRLATTPVITHLYWGDEHETPRGVVIDTIVQPKHFSTHLFTHWHEQKVSIEWTGHRFAVTKREVEPVIVALDRFCAHRAGCAKATLQDVEYVSTRRAHATFTGLPNHCEYGQPAVTVELAKTDRWRVVDLRCSTASER